MSLVIVRSNILLLRGPCDKGARIWHQPELTDGAVMELLAHWRGYIEGILKGYTGGDEVRDLDRVMDSWRRIARETL